MKLIDKVLEISSSGVSNTFPSNISNNILDEKDKHLFHRPPGEEHYRLLAEISSVMDFGLVYDIGTYKGLSALALAANESVDVISYDIRWSVNVNRPRNIEFRVGNFYNDPILLKADFIFVDIDPHDGSNEQIVLKYLKDHNYTGLVMFDDIYQFDGMKKFWESIEQPKHDLTHVGHWSGTGLVDFS